MIFLTKNTTWLLLSLQSGGAYVLKNVRGCSLSAAAGTVDIYAGQFIETAAGATVDVPLTNDTYLTSPAIGGDYNWGGGSGFTAGAISSNPMRALVRPNLTSILAQIVAAELHVYKSGGSGSGTINVHKVALGNVDWVEGTAEGSTQVGGSCWNKKVYNTTDWAGSAGLGTPATDYDVVVAGSVAYTASTGWLTIDLDATTIDSLRTGMNPGLLLKDSSESGTNYANLSSREAAANTPYLRVTYLGGPALSVLAGCACNLHGLPTIESLSGSVTGPYRDGSGVVQNSGISSGVTDHGALTGLLDDDHPQYVNNTSANRPGVTKLYRNDSDSGYNVQTYWTGARWRLYGYNGDTPHADTHVGYAEVAGSVAGGGSIPTGAMLMWPTASPPTGWLLCNGAAVSRSTYASLFAVIGTTFGTGNGSTTFNVPNFSGRSPQGADGSDTVGSTPGTKIQTDFPQHNHQQLGRAPNSTGSTLTYTSLEVHDGSLGGSSHNTGNRGNASGIDQRGPRLTVYFIIKY